MQRALVVAPPGLWIARMEFEGAGAVAGYFALDNFAVLNLELIFADGFEAGSTERWSLTVNPHMTPTPLPPTCDDIIVGDIDSGRRLTRSWEGSGGRTSFGGREAGETPALQFRTRHRGLSLKLGPSPANFGLRIGSLSNTVLELRT